MPVDLEFRQTKCPHWAVASIFAVLVIFGSGCEPLLPPVLIPWPDICQLVCDALARPVGKEALGITFSMLERWCGVV